MKKSFYHRFSDFIEGRGFYIILALCVAAVGISGWFLYSSVTREREERPVAGTASITVTPAPSAAPQTRKPVPTAAPRPAASAGPAQTAAPTPASTPKPAVPPQSAPASLAWPVRGEVLTGYTVETLAYDVTMGDWRTHAGIDIAAAAGTEVRAPASGVVRDVIQDVMMGTTVVLDHGGGLTTACSNLAAVPTVEVGNSVSVGAVIGSVGSTAIAESALPSHLHFTVERAGASVDPMELLNQ